MITQLILQAKSPSNTYVKILINMIPLRLKLTNFMCYREDIPEISFAGLHTVCISGENGSGKSALIDAMTWALWGESRAKSDTDLIAQGQTEMSVEFDFMIGDQIYRVIRKCSKPKTRGGSPSSVLEFQIASDGGFRSISEPQIRLTEKKIIDTLHMDYETFINSAFLKQGRADEFTKQPPAKRKEVLGNILGLGVYEDLENRAKESLNYWKNQIENLNIRIKDFETELSLKTKIETDLATANLILSTVEKTLGERESQLNILRKKQEALNNKVNQIKQLEEYINDTQNTLQQWQRQIDRHVLNIKQYEELISNKDEIDEGYARYLVLKNQENELNRKLSELNRLNQHKNRLEMSIERAKNTLLQEHAVVQRNITELKKKVGMISGLKSEEMKIEEDENNITVLESTLADKQKKIQDLRNQINQFQYSINTLQEQIKEINEKLELLDSDSGAKCPLCEQELGVEEKSQIKLKYLHEKNSKQEIINNNKRTIENQRLLLNQLEQETQKLESHLKQERSEIDRRKGILHKYLAEANEASEALKVETKRLAQIEDTLAKRNFALNEQQSLNDIMAQIDELKYNPEQHESIRRSIQNFSQYEEAKKKLDVALEQLDKERELLQLARHDFEHCENSLHNYLKQKELLSDEIKLLPQLNEDLANLQSMYQQAQKDFKEAQENVLRLQSELGRLERLQEKKKEAERELQHAQEQAGIYQELAQAFGKKGIQGLLIETAIPEIEQEANQLLARMTDNRMHIKMEAQRPTKAGEMVETLDINILDELGTRSYEMFSGGEAFRINFAIRIALSRLLARRAGAPLPTLIIDEGFGTQDSTGIERIKEAIVSIQNDFEKIFVITHIDDLKDAFPSRIEVFKTERGSNIQVN